MPYFEDPGGNILCIGLVSADTRPYLPAQKQVPEVSNKYIPPTKLQQVQQIQPVQQVQQVQIQTPAAVVQAPLAPQQPIQVVTTSQSYKSVPQLLTYQPVAVVGKQTVVTSPVQKTVTYSRPVQRTVTIHEHVVPVVRTVVQHAPVVQQTIIQSHPVVHQRTVKTVQYHRQVVQPITIHTSRVVPAKEFTIQVPAKKIIQSSVVSQPQVAVVQTQEISTAAPQKETIAITTQAPTVAPVTAAPQQGYKYPAAAH